nr:MAG TPA: hypothetical protein [Caudoviricetes sp.]
MFRSVTRMWFDSTAFRNLSCKKKILFLIK